MTYDATDADDDGVVEADIDNQLTESNAASVGGANVRTLDGTIAEFEQSLPERAAVVALTRDGETWVPDGSDRMEAGDAVTVLGPAAAAEAAIARLPPLSDRSP